MQTYQAKEIFTMKLTMKLIEIKTGIKALNKSKIIHSIPKGIPQYLITFPEPGFISSDIFLISMPLTNLGIK